MIGAREQCKNAWRPISWSARLGKLAMVVLVLGGGLAGALYFLEGNAGSLPAGSFAGAVSADELEWQGQELHQPVFWAGAISGMSYELARARGKITVRYVRQGSNVGRSVPTLTVATYPMARAFAATRAMGRLAGAKAIHLAGAGIAVTDRGRNVYLAYPGWPVRVKVSGSSPALAYRLVAGGRLQPLPGSPTPTRPTVVAVGLKGLKQIASSLARPIYWAGPRAGVTYELTRLGDGRIYLRYMPPGVAARSSRSVLTISTLPLRHAFAITRAGGKSTRAKMLALPRGGIATVAPTDESVYLAYPGSNYQAEVSAPSAGAAARLASSGHIVPVR